MSVLQLGLGVTIRLISDEFNLGCAVGQVSCLSFLLKLMTIMTKLGECFVH